MHKHDCCFLNVGIWPSKSTCGTCLSRQFEPINSCWAQLRSRGRGCRTAQCGRWTGAGPPGPAGSWGYRPLPASSPECKPSPRKQTNSLCLNATGIWPKHSPLLDNPQFSVLLFKKKPSLSDLVSPFRRMTCSFTSSFYSPQDSQLSLNKLHSTFNIQDLALHYCDRFSLLPLFFPSSFSLTVMY